VSGGRGSSRDGGASCDLTSSSCDLAASSCDLASSSCDLVSSGRRSVMRGSLEGSRVGARGRARVKCEGCAMSGRGRAGVGHQDVLGLKCTRRSRYMRAHLFGGVQRSSQCSNKPCGGGIRTWERKNVWTSCSFELRVRPSYYRASPATVYVAPTRRSRRPPSVCLHR
jgi:hypothetical protein